MYDLHLKQNLIEKSPFHSIEVLPDKEPYNTWNCHGENENNAESILQMPACKMKQENRGKDCRNKFDDIRDPKRNHDSNSLAQYTIMHHYAEIIEADELGNIGAVPAKESMIDRRNSRGINENTQENKCWEQYPYVSEITHQAGKNTCP